LCISLETVEVAFFVTGLETFQIQGVEMSTVVLERSKFCATSELFDRSENLLSLMFTFLFTLGTINVENYNTS
jgi:hypothetical protein